MLLLTGCAQTPAAPPPEGFLYDKWLDHSRGDGFTVKRGDDGIAYIVFDGSDAPERLIRDVFADPASSAYARQVFADGNTVYYLNQYASSHYAVIALDTRDFSERVVHEVKWSDNIAEMDLLFGLGAYLPKPKPQDEYVDCFFVYGDGLFLAKSSGVYRYDLQSGEALCICAGKGEDLAFADGAVFYRDELLDLYRFDLDSGTAAKLPIGKIERFYAAAEGLYCKDLCDGQFYLVCFDGTGKQPAPAFDEVRYLKGE